MESALEHERRFDLFGSHVRLLVGAPVDDRLPAPPIVAMQVEGFLRTLHARLTRFEADSELSRLNHDPAPAHEASPLLALAVRAALWAARRTGGLVDPVVLDALERAGYARSRVGLSPAPLDQALAAVSGRARAHPREDSPWSEFEVDTATGLISRPPGARIDLGGTAKGLAADLAAERLAGYGTFCVDAGGDLRIGGERPLSRVVEVTHPLGDAPSFFDAASGAVATSGLATRVWRSGDGYSHHLIDPATGEPAWTGVIQATARAQTGVEAEALAKAAVLGPRRGRRAAAGSGRRDRAGRWLRGAVRAVASGPGLAARGGGMTDPTQHFFWLASRATGIVALALVSISVAIGLSMAARLPRGPGALGRARQLHEVVALASLIAIGAHGTLLLGDSFLRPNVGDILIPFAMTNQPLWTGIGILAGWVAALLGLSFYARRVIGAATWRKLHRWIIAAYLMSVAHAIGSGTDGTSTWFLVTVGVLAAPILFAATYRYLPGQRHPAGAAGARGSAQHGNPELAVAEGGRGAPARAVAHGEGVLAGRQPSQDGAAVHV